MMSVWLSGALVVIGVLVLLCGVALTSFFGYLIIRIGGDRSVYVLGGFLILISALLLGGAAALPLMYFRQQDPQPLLSASQSGRVSPQGSSPVEGSKKVT